MSASFKGQTVWITGAGSGIGRRCAERLHAAGSSVIGIDRVFAHEAPFRQVLLDLANPAELDATVGALIAESPRIDVLIHAAGVLRLGNTDTISSADWNDSFSVNVNAAFHLYRQLAPVFRQQHSGSVVSVASNAGHVPRLGMAAYCASKAALASLTQCFGLEMAPHGVRCNLVSPGSTDTRMLREMVGGETGIARTIAGLPEAFKLGIPLGKVATVDDIASAILFLASGEAGHITLHDLVVDGGATLAA